MSVNINDLPPPWPNQALAQSRSAHSIPMKDPNLKVNPAVAIDTGGNSKGKAADASTKVDLKV